MHLLSMAGKQAEKSTTWGSASLMIQDAPEGTSPLLSIMGPSLGAMVCSRALPAFFSEGGSSS